MVMNRKIVITKLNDRIITAVLENEQVVELQCSSETRLEAAELGNIYIGKVKNIVPNIKAAFIEIAKGVECYYALEENKTPIFTKKSGKKPLCVGDELLVQVSKEAVKKKVPSVSSKLEFVGKYAVLTTGDTRIGVSNKLPKEYKERLLEIANQFQSDSYGIIMRTNAAEAEEEMLVKELKRLQTEYEETIIRSKTRVCYSCLKQTPKSYLLELKNVYQEGLSSILVEDTELYTDIKEYLESYQPEDLDKLCLYQDKLLPLHKLYSIETHIEHALKEYVWMKSGAYLVIQPTEALTVIDVNTGKCVLKKHVAEDQLKINLEAAKEAAKQIRLRNISGIILVDFINMDKKEHMDELLTCFQRELQLDPVATTLVDVTKLQLVEVTRKKIRKPFHEAFKS